MSAIWTYADYAALPEDGRRFEVIDGQLIEMPAPTILHQRVILAFAFAIDQSLIGTAWGILISPIDVRLSGLSKAGKPDSVVQPDLVVVPNGTDGAYVLGAPLVAIEVLSPSTAKHDQETKRELFERYGVGEFWIVDPVKQRVTVYRRVGKSFAPPTSHDFSETLEIAALPGIAVHLPEVAKRLQKESIS
jgi:Uma2 family endonuclease